MMNKTIKNYATALLDFENAGCTNKNNAIAIHIMITALGNEYGFAYFIRSRLKI